jgi:hypothetical protein
MLARDCGSSDSHSLRWPLVEGGRGFVIGSKHLDGPLPAEQPPNTHAARVMCIFPLESRLIWLIAALFTNFTGAVGAQTSLQYPFYYTTNGSAATIVDAAHVSGSVSIPCTLGGLPVRTIAARAFYGLRQVRSPSRQAPPPPEEMPLKECRN